MNFYKHYIGDYQRDTGHLSLTEHGAYRLMLDAFYATGKPLPADRKILYRLLRAATPVERKAIDSVSAQFWEATASGLVNYRAGVEIEKAEKQAEINRQIAVERERRKRHGQETKPAISPCIKTGMDEIIGNGALSDPVHKSGKVFEVYRVNNTHIVSSMQPFSQTNRATKEEPFVIRQEEGEGALSREPIQNQNHSQNQNQNNSGCGNTATMDSDGVFPEEHKDRNGEENKAQNVLGETTDARQGTSVVDEPERLGDDHFAGEIVQQDDQAVSKARDKDSGKMKSVSVSLAKAMQEAGIVAADGDPRLMEMARQGVDVDTVMAACSEAKRARPDERIGMAYVVKIVERWARDANSIAVRGARAHGRVCVHDQRKRALDELTGRLSYGVPAVSGMPFMLEGSGNEKDRDENLA